MIVRRPTSISEKKENLKKFCAGDLLFLRDPILLTVSLLSSRQIARLLLSKKTVGCQVFC